MQSLGIEFGNSGGTQALSTRTIPMSSLLLAWQNAFFYPQC